jgi:hypothetical protein
VARMPESIREEVLARARATGFYPQLKPDGMDLYDKLITLVNVNCPSPVKVDKVIGFSKSGHLRYLKVAIHPAHYRSELEGLGGSILPAVNRITGENLHSHSGYRGFGFSDRNNEPVGKAYKVVDMMALEVLLKGLSGRG